MAKSLYVGGANRLRCFSHLLRVLSTFFRAPRVFLSLGGGKQDRRAVLRVSLREASLALWYKRLRATRVDKARLRALR